MLAATARIAGRIAPEILATRCLYGSNTTHAILSAVESAMGIWQRKVVFE